MNYCYFKAPTMMGRIDYLEDVFLKLMQDGFAGSGVRVLDHGVCSGLLLLQAATFYFQVAYGMDHKDIQQPVDRKSRVRKKINQKCTEFNYSPSWWWRLTVWATAATALHNVAQLKPMTDLRTDPPGPLSIDEDPLAYLGILVDVLQEWDRPTVARGVSPVTGIGPKGPLQGIDVNVVQKGEILHLTYDSQKRADDARESLNWALTGWNNLVEITLCAKQ